MSLRLYNTLSKKIEALRPIDPRHVTFYSCGPTVYDYAHIGNFRSFLFGDVLRRFIESPLCVLENDGQAGPGTGTGGGRRVTHVMNITDVGHMTDDADGGENGEDRMAVAGRRLAEAKKSGKLPAGASIDPGDPYAIAAFYAQAFVEDAKRLGMKVASDADKDATLMPRATANVEGMKRVIERLMASGSAYVAGTPGRRAVYFDVRTFGAYGRLSGNTLDSLREGAGGRISESNQSEKRDPADFMLWKEDASHIMKWESPKGTGLAPGYPGWHIECTVMSAARLAQAAIRHGRVLQPEELAGLVVENAQPIIDLHSGGEDNIFPHHECEIAQSCCAFNASGSGTFAGMWVHARFLFVEGEKMSKSKGNFYTLRDLLAKGYEAAAIRMELIKTHYRSNANFTEQGLKDSQRIVDRWRRFVQEGSQNAGDGGEEGARSRSECRTGVQRALHEDLNVAGAIGEVNAWMGRVSKATAADAEFMRELDGVFGVLSLEQAAKAQTSIGVFIGCEADGAVIAKLEERAEAKKSKDFARSDALRGELAAMGYQIKDVAGGKVEVRRG